MNALLPMNINLITGYLTGSVLVKENMKTSSEFGLEYAQFPVVCCIIDLRGIVRDVMVYCHAIHSVLLLSIVLLAICGSAKRSLRLAVWQGTGY